MRDFSIAPVDGRLALDLSVECDSIVNHIALSLAIRKGEWWHDPEFGLDWPRRAKRTARTGSLLEQRCDQALKWIVDTGRASQIDVTVDVSAGSRAMVSVRAEQQDGNVVTFETYKEVF